MPRLFLQDPQPVAAMPRTNPNAYGAQVGAAMQETGRLGQALGQVMQEYAESESRAAAVRYEQDLKAGVIDIQNDPDIAGRGAKFDALQKRLKDAYTPKFGNRSAYESRAMLATNDVRTGLMSKTAADAIGDVRLNAELEADYRIQSAVQSGDETSIETAFVEAQGAFHDARLAYTPGEATAAFQKVVGSGIRSLAQTYPEKALKYIDRMGGMLGPEVQAVYRGQAMENIRQNAAQIRADSAQERADRERVEKEASDQAEEELVQLDASGGLTAAEVNRRISSGALDADSGRLWLDRVRNPPGGEGGGSGVNRDLYNSFRARADRGEYITPEVSAAYARGDIDKASRDGLINSSRTAAFGSARDFIRTSLDPRANPSDLDASTKLAQANLYFDEWALKHPDATREQAMEVAQRNVEGARATTSSRSRVRELIRPVGYVATKDAKGNETVDIDASSAELDRRLSTGLLDQDSYRQELVKLKRIADAQQAQADAQQRRAAALAPKAGE